MSRKSMIDAMPGRHPSLAGCGQFVADEMQVYFDIGWPEYDRDTAWARQLLDVWKIEQADQVMMSGRNSEGPWLSPVFEALRQKGVVYCTAEPYSWDVRRSVTMLSLLPIKSVIGLSDETAEALLADESGPRLLADVPVILARSEAVPALRRAGIDCAAIAMLGPALAAECPVRGGLHFDSSEWQFTEGPGGLVLSVVGDRKYQRQQVPLGVHGKLNDAPCGCGLPSARIVLT